MIGHISGISGLGTFITAKLQQKLEITNPSGSGSRDQRPGYWPMVPYFKSGPSSNNSISNNKIINPHCNSYPKGPLGLLKHQSEVAQGCMPQNPSVGALRFPKLLRMFLSWLIEPGCCNLADRGLSLSCSGCFWAGWSNLGCCDWLAGNLESNSCLVFPWSHFLA